MKPWEWLDQAGVRFLIKTGNNPGDPFFHLTEEQRQFIVLACRTFERAALCKKCGGLSWDIPLDRYCQCEFKGHAGHSHPCKTPK